MKAAQYQRLQARPDIEVASKIVGSSNKALERSLRLVVSAIADPGVLDGVSSALQLRIVGSLVQVYVKLFNSEQEEPFYLTYLDFSFEILIYGRSCYPKYPAN